MTEKTPTQKSYLVIGGCGFLGRHIVEFLLRRGEKHVKVFDIRKTFDNNQVEFIVGDMTKLEDVSNACKGVFAVIHTASPTAHNQGYDFFYKVNVTGTQNVIKACQIQKVPQLIFTSSASVVFDGTDIKNGDETLPYVKDFLDAYNKTKQLAEVDVLEANGKDGVMTVSLRPSGIFGPRDVQAWPGFIGVAKEKLPLGYNKSLMAIGDGKNIFDWTYVENVAYAHVLASDKMTPGSSIAGQAYFVTNGEPTLFWDMPRYIYKNFGYPGPSIFLPMKLMLVVAFIIGIIVTILSPIVKITPTFTKLRVGTAGANRYFSIEKIKRDLGYKPLYTVEEGKKKALEYFLNERKEGRI